MYAQAWNRGLPVLLVLALPGPARAQETRYLPSDTHVLVSLNVQEMIKSRTFAEFKSLMKKMVPDDFDAELDRGVGIPFRDVARLTLAVAATEKARRPPDDGPAVDQRRDIMVVTSTRPVRVEDVAAGRSRPGASRIKRTLTHTPLKLGDITLMEEEVEIDFGDKGKPFKYKGDSFCVIDGKTILYGSTSAIKSVLERKEKTSLSKNLEASLKIAPLSKTAVLAVDVDAMPERDRGRMLRDLGLREAKDLEGALQALVISASEPEKLHASATLVLRDEADAAAARKSMETLFAGFREKLKAAPRLPGGLEEHVKSARELLDVVKFSVKENRVTAEASVDPRVGVSFVALWLAIAETRDEKKAPIIKNEK